METSAATIIHRSISSLLKVSSTRHQLSAIYVNERGKSSKLRCFKYLFIQWKENTINYSEF